MVVQVCNSLKKQASSSCPALGYKKWGKSWLHMLPSPPYWPGGNLSRTSSLTRSGRLMDLCLAAKSIPN